MAPSIGHNSHLSGTQADDLRSFVERLQNLADEQKAIAADIKEVYAAAKGKGYDPKILRKCLKLLTQDPDKREEERALIDLYMQAIDPQMDLFEAETPPSPPPAPEKPARARKTAAMAAIEADEEATYQRVSTQVTGRSNVTAAMLHNQFKVPFDQAKRIFERLVREEIIPGELA